MLFNLGEYGGKKYISNSKYAQYFNRKYKRVGSLWQGRFKNYYVFDKNYLYVLFRYIEQKRVEGTELLAL